MSLTRALTRSIWAPVSREISDLGGDAWVYPSDIPAAEAQALRDLYDATGGAEWTDSTGWGTASLSADYYGITVAGGHVTVIALGANNLSTDNAVLDLSALALTEAGVDSILADLVTSTGTDGTVDLSGSAEPSSVGVGHITTLLSRGWTVTVSAADVAVDSGTLRIATKDGESMFFHDSIGFSDLISAGDLITFTDAAGKVATAYAGAAGGGRTLGTDLLADLDFTDGSTWFATPSASAIDATTFATSNSSHGMRGLLFDLGSLYFLDIAWSATSGDISVRDSVGGGHIFVAGSGSGYGTSVETERLIYLRASSICTVTVSAGSLHKLTDVPTTGLRLVSAAGGATRNMASVESGFNPNTIIGISI